MAKNSTKVALIYDFDETLSVDYMQSFGLIQSLGMKPDTFWKKANLWSANNNADQITGTMYYFMSLTWLQSNQLQETAKLLQMVAQLLMLQYHTATQAVLLASA